MPIAHGIHSGGKRQRAEEEIIPQHPQQRLPPHRIGHHHHRHTRPGKSFHNFIAKIGTILDFDNGFTAEMMEEYKGYQHWDTNVIKPPVRQLELCVNQSGRDEVVVGLQCLSQQDYNIYTIFTDDLSHVDFKTMLSDDGLRQLRDLQEEFHRRLDNETINDDTIRHYARRIIAWCKDERALTAKWWWQCISKALAKELMTMLNKKPKPSLSTLTVKEASRWIPLPSTYPI